MKQKEKLSIFIEACFISYHYKNIQMYNYGTKICSMYVKTDGSQLQHFFALNFGS